MDHLLNVNYFLGLRIGFVLVNLLHIDLDYLYNMLNNVNISTILEFCRPLRGAGHIAQLVDDFLFTRCQIF